MRIACSTSAWRGDLDNALGRVSALGFEYVDLICIAAWGHVTIDALREDYTAELTRVRGLLDRHRLTPIAANLGITPHLFERDDASIAERRTNVDLFLRLMKDLNVPVAGYYPGPRQSDADSARIYAATRESVREITRAAIGYGRRVGPELHWASNLETLEESRRILDDVSDLTVIYDPSHFIMQGIPIESTRFVLERAHHVHLRSADVKQMQAPLDRARNAIGWIIRTLGEIGYVGDVSIEYLPSDELDGEAEIVALRELIDVG